jgi:hypothetical protein
MENDEDRIIVLMLGYLCIATEPGASLERKVEILDRFDMTDNERARICGVTKVSAIANARLRYKKTRRAKI